MCVGCVSTKHSVLLREQAKRDCAKNRPRDLAKPPSTHAAGSDRLEARAQARLDLGFAVVDEFSVFLVEISRPYIPRADSPECLCRYKPAPAWCLAYHGFT